MTIGQRICLLRKAHGLKQKDLADYLNVAPSTISNYEKDCHEPDITSLNYLADLFGVSTDYLLGRTGISFDAALFDHHIYGNLTPLDLLELTEKLTKSDWNYLSKALFLLNCQYDPSFSFPESSRYNRKSRNFSRSGNSLKALNFIPFPEFINALNSAEYEAAYTCEQDPDDFSEPEKHTDQTPSCSDETSDPVTATDSAAASDPVTVPVADTDSGLS